MPLGTERAIRVLTQAERATAGRPGDPFSSPPPAPPSSARCAVPSVAHRWNRSALLCPALRPSQCPHLGPKLDSPSRHVSVIRIVMAIFPGSLLPHCRPLELYDREGAAPGATIRIVPSRKLLNRPRRRLALDAVPTRRVYLGCSAFSLAWLVAMYDSDNRTVAGTSASRDYYHDEVISCRPKGSSVAPPILLLFDWCAVALLTPYFLPRYGRSRTI